jgi:hypothetical protein
MLLFSVMEEVCVMVDVQAYVMKLTSLRLLKNLKRMTDEEAHDHCYCYFELMRKRRMVGYYSYCYYSHSWEHY